MRIPGTATISALALAAVLTAAPAGAEGWNYDLGIYAYGTGLDGTVGVGPVEGDIDLSFSDIVEDLDFAAFVFFRAETDSWAVMIDTIFVDLSAGGERFETEVE